MPTSQGGWGPGPEHPAHPDYQERRAPRRPSPRQPAPRGDDRLLNGRWSRAHARCVSAQHPAPGTDIPHAGHGYCRRHYYTDYLRQQRRAGQP